MGTNGNSEMSPSSSSENVPIRAAKKSDSKKSQSSNSVSSQETAQTSIEEKSSGGPRTLQGKERSKHNALKHGVFSSVLLLKGESKDAFDFVLNGLRDHFQPEGVLEGVLVEKLAALIWRLRRVLVSEGAEIQSSGESSEWPKKEKKVEKFRVVEVTDGRTRQEDAALLDDLNDPIAVHKSLRFLEQLRDRVEKNGCCPSKLEDFLIKLLEDSGAKVSDLGWPEQIVHRFSKGKPADGESQNNGPSIPENMRELSMSLIDKKLAQFRSLQSQHDVTERNRREIERLRQQVPDNPGAERLLRYETSLERSFDRTLNQLERIQRMRKGQLIPPPIKLDVTTS